MPMLEYTQKDNADTIQGRVMGGHGLKQEGEFRIDIAHNGAGWAWSMNVEIEGKAVARTETESDHPYENLTWQEAAALAKTRVVELATVLEAELEGGGPPPPAPPRNSEKEDSMDRARAEMNGESTSEPTRWEAVKEAVGAGITRAREEYAALQQELEESRAWAEEFKLPLWARAVDRMSTFIHRLAALHDPDYELGPHEDTRKYDVEAEEGRRWKAEIRESAAAWIAGHPEEARELVDYEHYPDEDARKAYEDELIRRNREIEADPPKAPPLMETVQQRGGGGVLAGGSGGGAPP